VNICIWNVRCNIDYKFKYELIVYECLSNLYMAKGRIPRYLKLKEALMVADRLKI